MRTVDTANATVDDDNKSDSEYEYEYEEIEVEVDEDYEDEHVNEKGGKVTISEGQCTWISNMSYDFMFFLLFFFSKVFLWN